jgi:hypothetical protein
MSPLDTSSPTSYKTVVSQHRLRRAVGLYIFMFLRDRRLLLWFTWILSSFGLLRSPETSMRNQPTLRNIPEDDG